jgi:RNA methyltransferase, TrmH family
MKFNRTSNRIQTLVRKLKRRKYRVKENLFIAEGERCVEQILKNGFITIEEVIISDNFKLSGQLIDFNVEISALPPDEFDALVDTDNPQGVLALCHLPEKGSVNDIVDKAGLIIALDTLQDPGNLGTIIRTAAWFDVTAILTGIGTADAWHPKVVRSTAGATGSIPLIRGDLEKLFQKLEKAGWNVFLLDGGENSANVRKIHKCDKTVLVIGNEANGINPDLLTSGRDKVRIDGNSQTVESLNAAIAAGIAMYHLQGL